MLQDDHPLEIDLSDDQPGPMRYLYGALVVVALVVGYIWLANDHSQSLQLTREGAEVRVEKGIYAPFGWSPYVPTTAFEPVLVENEVTARTGPCADLADCEARLFSVVLTQARLDLARPERLERAMALVAQAVKLSSAANRDALRGLEDQQELVKGTLKVSAARTALAQARVHFKGVRGQEPAVQARAEAWVKALDKQLADLRALELQLDPRRVPRPDSPQTPASASPQPSAPAPVVPTPAPAAPAPVLPAPVAPAQPAAAQPQPPAIPVPAAPAPKESMQPKPAPPTAAPQPKPNPQPAAVPAPAPKSPSGAVQAPKTGEEQGDDVGLEAF